MPDHDSEIIPESGLLRLSDAAWREARRRAAVIAPLGDQDSVSVSVANEAATALGVSQRCVYKFIRRWKESDGSLLALAPHRSHGGRGKRRLSEAVEQIVTTAISRYYLTRQRRTAADLRRIIQDDCRGAGVRCPSLNTVRSRIAQLDPSETARRRHGNDAARRLTSADGRFPDVSRPLDVVQIDHTRVDLVIVDAYTRQPIGRPWITVAIDVYSRCIVGICLTLEPPSAVSVGLCLAHAATDKRPWLERMGVEAAWPMVGKPRVIHVDNGAEFHSEALRRGCETHGIRIVYRPPGQPHFGGIVERVIGTLMHMVHALPGTTFSSVSERGDYDSERTAALTLSELERWFALAITGPYHSSVHSGIGEAPSTRWNRGVENSDPLPAIRNPKAFLVDFLPVVRRRIQRQGFVIDHIVYSSNAIRPWVTERDRKQRFVVRRDPRDLSRVFVLHPEEDHYVEVPYRAMSHPAITLWEHRQAIARLRHQRRSQVDEEGIFKAVREMRSMTEKAVGTTKTARRSATRRAHLLSPEPPRRLVPPGVEAGTIAPVKPFDIEFW